jgi:hypothetical protein
MGCFYAGIQRFYSCMGGFGGRMERFGSRIQGFRSGMERCGRRMERCDAVASSFTAGWTASAAETTLR